MEEHFRLPVRSRIKDDPDARRPIITERWIHRGAGNPLFLPSQSRPDRQPASDGPTVLDVSGVVSRPARRRRVGVVSSPSLEHYRGGRVRRIQVAAQQSGAVLRPARRDAEFGQVRQRKLRAGVAQSPVEIHIVELIPARLGVFQLPQAAADYLAARPALQRGVVDYLVAVEFGSLAKLAEVLTEVRGKQPVRSPVSGIASRPDARAKVQAARHKVVIGRQSVHPSESHGRGARIAEHRCLKLVLGRQVPIQLRRIVEASRLHWNFAQPAVREY